MDPRRGPVDPWGEDPWGEDPWGEDLWLRSVCGKRIDIRLSRRRPWVAKHSFYLTEGGGGGVMTENNSIIVEKFLANIWVIILLYVGNAGKTEE